MDVEFSTRNEKYPCIAVIDTGIDYNHPDFYVVVGKDCTNTTGDYCFVLGNGTHVAGIIGIKMNTRLGVGLALGTPLYSFRAFDSNGVGYWSNVICGVDGAIEHSVKNGGNIEVINASLTGGRFADPEHETVLAAVRTATSDGLIIAAGEGNDNIDAQNIIPCAYDEVICAAGWQDLDGQPGCITPNDIPAPFSNYGTIVDVQAPAVNTLSTSMGGAYEYRSGTSMASPNVAGAVLRYIADSNNRQVITFDIVKNAIIVTGEPEFENRGNYAYI